MCIMIHTLTLVTCGLHPLQTPWGCRNVEAQVEGEGTAGHLVIVESADTTADLNDAWRGYE